MKEHTKIVIDLPSSDQRLSELRQYLRSKSIPFIKSTSPDLSENLNKLGKQGLDVLRFLSEGYTYMAIAKELEITIDGVRYYVKKIYKVLEVNKAAQAVRLYARIKKNELKP